MSQVSKDKQVRFYTGVGSRKTPSDICSLMTGVAAALDMDNSWVLRSGNAEGADKAFQKGSFDYEVYRPRGEPCFHKHISVYGDEEWGRATEIVAKIHPAWGRCSNYVKGLHTRNVFQVLGWNLSNPSRFLLCWTPDGAINYDECSRQTGGTGTAIKVACMYNVPVFNLKLDTHRRRVEKWLYSGDALRGEIL